MIKNEYSPAEQKVHEPEGGITGNKLKETFSFGQKCKSKMLQLYETLFLR